MRAFKLLVVIAGLSLAQALIAADPPAAPKAPAKPAEFLIGEMHVQTIPAMTYLYGAEKTTFDKMVETIGKHLPAVTKALDEGKARSAGCALFMYRDVKDMTQPFNMEIGWVVPEDTKPVGDLKVRKVEPFKCATILMTGPVANIGKAYEKLHGAMAAAGIKPGTESHEMYLYWESPESLNNVVQIQMAIQ